MQRETLDALLQSTRLLELESFKRVVSERLADAAGNEKDILIENTLTANVDDNGVNNANPETGRGDRVVAATDAVRRVLVVGAGDVVRIAGWAAAAVKAG